MPSPPPNIQNFYFYCIFINKISFGTDFLKNIYENSKKLFGSEIYQFKKKFWLGITKYKLQNQVKNAKKSLFLWENFNRN